MKKITIAELNVELSMIDTIFLDKRMHEYENNTFSQRDMILRTIACNKIEKPKGNLIKTINTTNIKNIVQIDDDKICRYATDEETGQVVQAVYYNRDYSDVEILLIRSRQYMGLSLTDYEYLLTGIAFSDRLIKLGGLVLHGSAIAYEGNGIVFSANCGTGKSTHTGLWEKCYGDKVTIVNDDKPALRFYDNTPFIFGTPWSGKTDLNTNTRAPLKAIIFIKQSKTNYIERLNTRESIFNLSSQIDRPYYDEELGIKTIEFIEKLVMTVPIYRLHCNISLEAVDTVHKKLTEEGIL